MARLSRWVGFKGIMHKPKRKIEALALHEAGHAVLALIYGFPAGPISLDKETRFQPRRFAALLGGQQDMKTRELARVALAGCLAESQEGQNSEPSSGEEDLEFVSNLVEGVAKTQVEQKDVLDQLIAETRYLLDKNWRLVAAISQELSERGVLSENDIIAVIKATIGDTTK